MNKRQMEILKQILSMCSEESRVDMAIEEMSELTKELLKYRRYKGQPEYLENIKEELADVEIMLAQIKQIFEISEEDISSAKDYKLYRTISKLREDK